ncbi:hypothetical protein [Oleiharenicola lentus]|uniref:hypothetical protein n=1 Tax=Oleiharenicola lentus TaxID=2508720 RepID=UPI003F663DAC
MKNIRLIVSLIAAGVLSVAVVRAHDDAKKETAKPAEKSCCAEKKAGKAGKEGCCAEGGGKSCCEGEKIEKKAEPKKLRNEIAQNKAAPIKSAAFL